jgi:hypothetical protein
MHDQKRETLTKALKLSRNTDNNYSSQINDLTIHTHAFVKIAMLCDARVPPLNFSG